MSALAPLVGPEVLIEAEDVSLALGGRAILEGVSLRVHRGEIVTLIGPNGSGKTTLVRVLLGLERPDRGRVRSAAGGAIGYVPQSVSLDPSVPLTVRRFLELGSAADEAARARVLDEVGAGYLLDVQMRTLSGGEAKRAVLARALLRAPTLLVLDEPTAGVDAVGQAELYALIAEIRAQRACGVLLVSHNLHLVMAATDEVVCLNHHVCCRGHPEAVRRDPEYLALFGPELAGATAVYSHAHDHRHDLAGAPVEEHHDHA